MSHSWLRGPIMDAPHHNQKMIQKTNHNPESISNNRRQSKFNSRQLDTEDNAEYQLNIRGASDINNQIESNNVTNQTPKISKYIPAGLVKPQ